MKHFSTFATFATRIYYVELCGVQGLAQEQFDTLSVKAGTEPATLRSGVNPSISDVNYYNNKRLFSVY